MKKYVLVVDDSNEVREIISFVLEQIGLDVVTVGSGEEMPPMLTPRVPDLILLDVMMPGEDGFQLCRSLREQVSTAHVPIIIMTAHDEGIYRHISKDVGASQHITKPFHPGDLAEKVKALLDAEKIEN